MYKLKIIQKNH